MLHSIDLSSFSKREFINGSEGITMSVVISTMYFSFQVGDQIKWYTHLSYTFKKISRDTSMLEYSKRYLAKKNLPVLYRSLVEPYLMYYCPIWGSCGTSALDML